jgi:chemotaxis protein MotB
VNPSSAAQVRRIIKKRGGGGHGHHGGAWKVAYADFVTAMMALFMIMWLLASTDSKSRAEISRYFRSGILPEGSMAMNSAAQVTPSVIERSPTPPAPDKANVDVDVSKIEGQVKRIAEQGGPLAEIARQVSVKQTDEGILIEIVDEEDGGLLFKISSSDLTPALAAFLKSMAPTIGSIMGKVEIHGHTDARPFVHGANKSNWDLSYERAAAARVILETSGLQPGQVDGVVGRAASQLYVPDDPYSARNRRLSILITP